MGVHSLAVRRQSASGDDDSPNAKIQKWQRRLNWLQRRLGDNCRLDRNVQALVRTEPFENVSLDEFYLEQTPRTHGYIYMGTAKR